MRLTIAIAVATAIFVYIYISRELWCVGVALTCVIARAVVALLCSWTPHVWLLIVCRVSSMPDRVLIWGSGSAPCWRVMIALEEKGLQYESKQIEFSSSRLVQSCDQLRPENCALQVSHTSKACCSTPLSNHSRCLTSPKLCRCF